MEPRVTFEEDRLVSARRQKGYSPAGITGMFIKYSRGLIKTPVQANVAMLLLTAVAVFVCYVLLTGNERGLENFEPQAGYEVVRPENGPPRLQRL